MNMLQIFFAVDAHNSPTHFECLTKSMLFDKYETNKPARNRPIDFLHKKKKCPPELVLQKEKELNLLRKTTVIT